MEKSFIITNSKERILRFVQPDTPDVWPYLECVLISSKGEVKHKKLSLSNAEWSYLRELISLQLSPPPTSLESKANGPV